MNTSHERILVAAAVVRKNGKTLVCSRPRHSSLTGYYEFPGGKCEPGETPELCIVREIKEELGVLCCPFDRIYTLNHDYPEKKVKVVFIRCFLLSDTLTPLDNQDIKWVETKNLSTVNFLPADLPLANILAESDRITASCQNFPKSLNPLT